MASKIRKYVGTVTLTITCPDGKTIGTKSETIELNLPQKEIGSPAECDAYMADELETMLAAAAYHAEDCFD